MSPRRITAVHAVLAVALLVLAILLFIRSSDTSAWCALAGFFASATIALRSSRGGVRS